MPSADELKEQGVQQYMRGDYEQAVETFRTAAAQYEDDGAGDMVAEMQVNLGLALHALGDSDGALEQMNMARAVFAQIDDQKRMAMVLGNMGRVYAGMGNTEQAITNYREASAAFIELDDEENYGETVLAIADLQLRGGKIMQAVATYEVGLDYVKNLNARQKLMKNLIGLKNKLTGGGLPPIDNSGDADADTSDE